MSVLLRVSRGFQGISGFLERHDICILTWVAQAGERVVDDVNEGLLRVSFDCRYAASSSAFYEFKPYKK